MAPKKVAEKVEARTTLSAVVLADTFTQKFRPITVECPKVLLPLVHAPMLEYTLEWLALNKVEEIFVFCCAHAEQITKYLQQSKWSKQHSVKVRTVVSTNCLSTGEAMRVLDQKDILKSDFVLVTGDTVSNMKLAPVLEAHRQRREKDKNCIMTMVMQPVQHPAQRTRLGDIELVVALDAATQRLLRYQELEGGRRGSSSSFKLDASFFGERDHISVRSDLMDTHIAVCAPEVLMLFSDNFDYQNIKRDFVTGVLSEEELGNKLFIHELQGEYAARVHNLRSYDAISRDILQRWATPLVPDSNVLHKGGTWGPSSFSSTRGHRYIEQRATVARNAKVGNNVCIGAGTYVGDDAVIVNSVIGRGCKIGSKAHIEGCYIQDGVQVHDGAVLQRALVCERAVIKQSATVSQGAIISYGVVVGQQHTVPPYARISLCQQLQSMVSMSDDELEYSQAGKQQQGSDDSDAFDDEDEQPTVAGPSPLVARAAELMAAGRTAFTDVEFDEQLVGAGGAGFEWGSADAAEVVRYSLALPPHRPAAVTGAEEEEPEEEAGSVAGDQPEESEEAEVLSPEASFKREVSETFLRCVKMSFDQANAVIELNALKIAEDRTFADCARYIFTTLLSLCLPAPPRMKSDYRDLFPGEVSSEGKVGLLKVFRKQLAQWASLLQRFLRNEDDQVELLLTFEEFCSEEAVFEGTGENGSMFAPIFAQVLKLLYDEEVVSEEACIAWADEKEHADEADKVYLKKAADFITWLREADEEEEDEEESEEDE